MKYYKVLNRDVINNAIQHKEGSQGETTILEDRTGQGLFFLDEEHLFLHCDHKHKFIAEVEIPENELVHSFEHGIYETHRLIIKNLRPLWDVETLRDLKKEGVKFTYCNKDFFTLIIIETGKVDVATFFEEEIFCLRKQPLSIVFDLYIERGHMLANAVRCGHLDITEHILRVFYLEQDVLSQDLQKAAKIILNRAAEYGRLEILKYFKKEMDADYTMIEDSTLCSVLNQQHWNILCFLMKKGLTLEEISEKTGYPRDKLIQNITAYKKQKRFAFFQKLSQK